MVGDVVKRGLVRLNLFPEALHRLGLVRYEDRIRWRSSLYASPVLLEEEGQQRIGALLSKDEPLLVARLGSVELSCLRFFLQHRSGRKRPYPSKIRQTMGINAGFFPTDDGSLDAVAALYLEHLTSVDVLAVWFNMYEDVVCNRCCPAAQLVELGCLEPFRFSNPWSAVLAGKKVLVIHPFADSIARQYAEKRQVLFKDGNVLPEFELKTIKAVQSSAGAAVGFATWFDALRYMRGEMEKVDFDICLVGAGAYGLPLAAFAKQAGKKAIHIGGATQLLFGIKGRRWETVHAETTRSFFNEHWVKATAAETPSGKDSVEGGCYW